MYSYRNPHYSIVIPFFNNIKTIPLCLPSVVQLKNNHDCITEIIAIDDCSTDGTAEILQMEYPQITLLKNSETIGFGKNCNKGIKSAHNDWIILLNSDVKIISEILPSLDKAIHTIPDLFQVSFNSFDENGEPFEGQKFFINKTGLYKTRNNFSVNHIDGKYYETIYACGGHCLLSRGKFLHIDGFSPVFEPFYWEDADLSYRALKRGWKVVFDPSCRVMHCHRGSIRSSNCKRQIDTIQKRNILLFFWKNISSVRLWLNHLTGLVFRFFSSWITGDFIFYSAFFSAFLKIPFLVKARSLEKKHWVLNDLTLFKIAQSD